MKVETLIIGSGIAAAAVSQRLLAYNSDASILILEAGTSVKMKDSAIWQNYILSGKLPYTQYYDLPFPDRDQVGENVSIGKTKMPLEGSRIFAYGGSTMHWGGWSFRLKPEDFLLHTNTGFGIDWPFQYEVLEPYYGQAEHYIGVSGDSQDISVPRSGGYPFNPFPYTYEDKPIAMAMESLGIAYSHLPIARQGLGDTVSHHAPCQTTGTCKYCPFGARYSANNFLDEMQEWKNYPNLEIRLNSIVQSIVSNGNVVSGALYKNEKGEEVFIEAERVIVAAGTVESAKLLLRSASPYWPDGIGNRYGLVGKNIVNHPFFIFSAELESNPKALQPEVNFPTLCSRHFDSPEEQKRGKFILINPAGSPSINLLRKMQSGSSREEIDSYVKGPAQVQIHGMVEIFSEMNNGISNTEKINRLGMRETLMNFSKSDGFDERIVEIGSHVNRVFEAMGTKPLGNPIVDWRADHATCTLRMSNDDSQGVTDENMKVHGTTNLYICSNAAFSSLGAVNPTLTLAALALRLGDYLSNGRDV